jgi:hypothetical protein
MTETGLAIPIIQNGSGKKMSVLLGIDTHFLHRTRAGVQRPLDGIHDIILYAGVNPSIRFTPPPAGG